MCKIKRFFNSYVIILSGALMMFCVDNIFSQEYPNWYNNVSIPPSPNAASLGQYGEIPVDKSTGLVDISIPVMTIGTGNLSIPITISYHGGGIKVNELSSLVGLGWALNAGGVITRSVDGRPDDMGNGYLANSSRIPDKTIVSQEIEIVGLREKTLEMLVNIAEGLFAYKPDKFFFNFPGHSGSFVFDNNGTPQLIPYEKIKIIPEFDNGEISGFIVIDENGIKYYFGNFDNNQCTEHSFVETGQFGIPGYNSSWYLNKIVDVRTNTIIKFFYDSYLYILPTIYSDTKTYTKGTNGLYSFNPNYPVHSGILTSIQNSKCISHIIFDDNVINFTNSSSVGGGRKIDTIRWVNGRLEREFVFDYSSFGPGRLKLTGMREISGGLEKEYLFDYNNTDLPAINSNSQDFGGYYNGASNSSLVPSIEIGEQTLGDANRSPSEYHSKACILEKITYPTGGYSNFFYGLNEFGESEPYSDLDAAVGLRIEQIRNYDPASNKTYYRTFDYCSSGYSTVTNPAKYYFNTEHIRHSQGEIDTNIVIFSAPSSGLGASANSVAYDEVKEYYGTESDNIGKTCTSFVHALDDGANKIPYPPRLSNQWKRSKITQEQQFEYDPRSSSYNLVLQKDYTYTSDDSYSFPVNCFHSFQVVYESGSGYVPFASGKDYFLYDNYTINTSKLRLDSLTVINFYDNGDEVSNTMCYYYDNPLHLNPTRIESIDSKGNEKKVVVKYPMDYTSCTDNCVQEYKDDIAVCDSTLPKCFISYSECRSIFATAYSNFIACISERNRLMDSKCRLLGTRLIGCEIDVFDDYDCPGEMHTYLVENNYYECLDSIDCEYLGCTAGAQYDYFGCKDSFDDCLSYDFKNSSGNQKAISYMNISNMLNIPIEKFTYINSQETEHIKWNYEITSDSIVILSSTEKSYGGEPLITEITYDQYDYKGNPGVVVEKGYGLEAGYVWGYDNTLPIAKITNAAYVPFKYVYNTINNNLSRSRYSPTTGIALNSFTINYFPQDVSFTVDSIYDYNIPALADILITMTIKEISSGETVSTCEFTSGNLYKEVNLEPGSYRIEYSKDANISYYCNFLYNDVTRNWSSSRASEVFYEGFEETGTVDNVVSKTGDYVYCGEYSVPLSDKVEGAYKLTYWTSTDGINWERNDSTITVDEYSTTLNIGSEGVCLDEIRLHPPDAQMTTYTYDPLIGMTSETDPNGLTTYYEYDSFGRLEYIKDNDHNILKAYRYHYADQEQ